MCACVGGGLRGRAGHWLATEPTTCPSGLCLAVLLECQSCATLTGMCRAQVIAIGGVIDSGEAGYHAEDTPHLDNPSYEVYDPATG